MKVVDAKNPQTQPFDIPSGLARILISKGDVHEYQPNLAPGEKLIVGGVVFEREPEHNLSFSIQQFKDGAPYLYANCPRCKPRFVYSGPNPESQSFRHDGKEVKWPADLVADYLTRCRVFYPENAGRRLVVAV